MNGAQGAHILVLGLKVHAPVAHSANCPPVSLRLCSRVLFAQAAAYIQNKRKLDEAEALLRRYLELQTTPQDPGVGKPQRY